MSGLTFTGRNMVDFLSILVAPFQTLEDTLQQMLTMRTVDSAQGVNLDIIGKIVGQARIGAAVGNDDIYRQYIRARIATNLSRGLPQDLYTIARLITGTTPLVDGRIIVRTVWNATFILELQDIPVDEDTAIVLQQMLVAAVSAGVRIVIIYSARPLAQTFRFDVGPGWDQGHLARGIDYRSTP